MRPALRATTASLLLAGAVALPAASEAYTVTAG
jgi:hypothetical protein